MLFYQLKKPLTKLKVRGFLIILPNAEITVVIDS